MKTISKWMGAVMLAAALFATNIMAQQLEKPTLEQLIPGGDAYRFTENRYGMRWWGDVCVDAGMEAVERIDPKNGRKTTLFTLQQVKEAYTRAGIEHKPANLYGATFPTAGEPVALLSGYTLYNWQTGEVTRRDDLPKEPAAGYDYHTGSRNLAYTVKNNLYVNGTRVTSEPEGIVCGQSVHRNEFGISKGTFWSEAGDKLAFYRMNESMVTPYPLVDITQRIGTVDKVRYPMAGMLSHEVKVGIYDVATRKTLYLQAGDPKDRYFTNIAWAPDGQSLFLIEVNRDQNHARLCQYSAVSGALMRVLIEETHPKYVEPQHAIVFLPWDDETFIYQSRHSGYNHLYLARITPYEGDAHQAAPQESPLAPRGYEPIAALGQTAVPATPADEADPGFTLREPQLAATPAIASLTQLTQGDWLVQEVLGFNARKREIVFTATRESPLQSNIYKVSAGNGKITPVGTAACAVAEGVHRAQLSASGTYVIDNYSTPTVPRRIDLVSTQSGKHVCLFEAKNPFEGLEMPIVETGTLKAADGVTDLHYRLCKPADFDPAKKYPVIVYVYGGPHAQMIVNNFNYAARGWDLYMPSRGYIMFTLDNRGSDNRSLEFENCTFRRLGIEECRDQVKGVEFLKSLPYVDATRIGVHGWSFGGHMTTALMLRHPDTFKAGVAGGPVIDWGYYEVMYGERYMDTPQTNPEGYRETNLNNLAGNLKGHLLIIHDDHDDTCVPQHTLSFMKACVDARTYPDLFIYPCHKHNVMGRDRVHLHEKITRYFEEYLAE